MILLSVISSNSTQKTPPVAFLYISLLVVLADSGSRFIINHCSNLSTIHPVAFMACTYYELETKYLHYEVGVAIGEICEHFGNV